MIISASALARSIEQTAAKLGTQLPAPLIATLQASRALAPAAAATEGMTASLNAAGLAALRENRDPGACPEVQRLATLVTLAANGIRHAAVSDADDAIAAALNTHSEAILTGWGTALVGDLAVLQSAAQQLEVPVLDKADPLMLRRAGLLNEWASASASSERCDWALAGVRALLTVLHANTAPEFRVLQLAPDASIDAYIAANAAAGPREVTAWTVARTLSPLRLITSIADFHQACARISGESQQQQRDSDQADAETRTQRTARQWVRVR
jgi:hypothetical protein